MIRACVRVAVIGAVAAWLIDLALRRRAGGASPRPIELLAVIDAPIERVWKELIDIEGQPRWMHDMKSVRMDVPGPARVGATGEATVRIYGVAVSDPVTITILEPPRRFGIAHEGLFSGSGVFELERGADGSTTIVRWEERLSAPIIPHLGAALTEPIFQHVFQGDLERFRELVESGA